MMGMKEITGLITNQNIIENTKSKARYGNARPKKPINHQVEGLRKGTRHAIRKRPATIAFNVIKNFLKNLLNLPVAML
jgi:hypothetical protein